MGEITRLGASTAVIAGGPASVSNGFAQSLTSIGNVYQAAGADRFQTSAMLNEAFYDTDGTNTDPTATAVLLASGANFPDSLSAVPWAGLEDSPLYEVPANCVPDQVDEDIHGLSAGYAVVVGGTAALSDNVFNLVPCSGPTATGLPRITALTRSAGLHSLKIDVKSRSSKQRLKLGG
jgi:putative cell wall-binding protein